MLRVLAAHPEGLSVSALAVALGTHRAGVYRLLGPLVSQRLVARDRDGLHTLDIGLIELASAVRPRLQEVATPELQRLADELSATTALTIREGEEAVVLTVLEPRNSDMHIAYRAGIRHALDQAAAGIAILAAQPPRRGERRAISNARSRGWAQSSGELIPGASGVAAALATTAAGVEASISAVWIEGRDPAHAAEAVLRAARAISDALA